MDGLKIVGDASALEFSAEETVKCPGKGLDVKIEGHGNKISVGKGVVFNGFSIIIQSNNNRIEIGDGCRLTGNVVMKIVDGNCLSIGENTSIGGANFICGEGTKISIGEDCMIAWNIEFRSTDSHAIIDRSTGNRINPAKDIAIEDHVWIGAHSTILKGSRVRKNSVVSIKSLVSKDFTEENVVLAGVPASIVKRDITWERPLLG